MPAHIPFVHSSYGLVHYTVCWFVQKFDGKNSLIFRLRFPVEFWITVASYEPDAHFMPSFVALNEQNKTNIPVSTNR